MPAAQTSGMMLQQGRAAKSHSRQMLQGYHDSAYLSLSATWPSFSWPSHVKAIMSWGGPAAQQHSSATCCLVLLPDLTRTLGPSQHHPRCTSTHSTGDGRQRGRRAGSVAHPGAGCPRGPPARCATSCHRCPPASSSPPAPLCPAHLARTAVPTSPAHAAASRLTPADGSLRALRHLLLSIFRAFDLAQGSATGESTEHA